MLCELSAAAGGQGVDRQSPKPARGRPARKRLVLLMLAAATGLTASPASANVLNDCFERVAVAAHHVVRPRAAAARPAAHRVRHVGPRRHPRPHRVAAARPPAAYAQRTHYVLRPRACGTHEAQMSPLAAAAPEAPELLLSELAGPTPPPVADFAEAPPSGLVGLPAPSGTEFFPGGTPTGVTPGGGFVFPGGGGPGGGPGGPGQPPVGPPPVVVPPDQPPVLPPGQPGGPPVLPPVTPPVLPPVIPVVDNPGGPGGPGVPGGPAGVPEPATWAMLVIGFFGLGAALRRRRAVA